MSIVTLCALAWFWEERWDQQTGGHLKGLAEMGLEWLDHHGL